MGFYFFPPTDSSPRFAILLSIRCGPCLASSVAMAVSCWALLKACWTVIVTGVLWPFCLKWISPPGVTIMTKSLGGRLSGDTRTGILMDFRTTPEPPQSPHGLAVMPAAHRLHLRSNLAIFLSFRAFDQVFSYSQTTRNHDLAVLGERLADRCQRFLDRGVDEAAGVDDHQVGAGVVGRGEVALGAQLREDALGIDQRLGAAERDEADFRGATFQCRSWPAG